MGQTFQLRRGTAAEWEFANPILQAGEMGYDASANRIKVGTGVDQWSSLLYIESSASSVDWSNVENRPSTFPPDTTNQAFQTYVGQAVSSHADATINVHGIADTSAIIVEGDSRLTDSRTPTAHVHSISNVTGLQAALDAKSGTDHLHDDRYALIGSVPGESPVQSVAGRTGNIVLAGEDIVSGTLNDARLSGNVVFTADARLSNSREWIASTVTSQEAAAGISSERRAWTPLRVFEAVAAWWGSSSAKEKLDGIQSNATANSSDAVLLARQNHTGSQAISTVTSLQQELDAKASLASPTFTGFVGIGVTGIVPLHVRGSGTVAIFGDSLSAFQFYASNGGASGIVTIGSPTSFKIGTGGLTPVEVVYGNSVAASYTNTQVKLPLGLLASGTFTPGISFLSDPDTGFGTAEANTISACTAGVERARFKSTGSFRMVPLASDPASGNQAGDIYYNGTTGAVKAHDGSSWEGLVQSADVSKIRVLTQAAYDTLLATSSVDPTTVYLILE